MAEKTPLFANNWYGDLSGDEVRKETQNLYQEIESLESSLDALELPWGSITGKPDFDSLYLGITDAASTYLPLAGGTLTGDLSIGSNKNLGVGTSSDASHPIVIQRGALNNLVGISQEVYGGASTMEFLTEDSDGDLTPRIVLRGGSGTTDIEFLYGELGSESLFMLMDGSTGDVSVETGDLSVSGGFSFGAGGTIDGDVTIDGSGRSIIFGTGDDGGPNGIEWLDNTGSTTQISLFYRTGPDTLTFEDSAGADIMTLDPGATSVEVHGTLIIPVK